MPDMDLQTIINETFRRLNEAGRRLRVLEERMVLMETSISNDKEATIINQSETSKKLEKVSEQLRGFEERLLKVENEIVRINKVVEKTAKKSDVDEVRGMISLMNPLNSHFVTESEVKKIIDEKLSKSVEK